MSSRDPIIEKSASSKAICNAAATHLFEHLCEIFLPNQVVKPKLSQIYPKSHIHLLVVMDILLVVTLFHSKNSVDINSVFAFSPLLLFSRHQMHLVIVPVYKHLC